MAPEMNRPILDEILASADTLPPFPDVVWKVMPLLKAMAPINQIEAVIKYDPVITARVLAFSRSPHFNRNRRIDSLQDAILLLGQQQLIQVILTACSAKYLAGKTASGYELMEGELWEHSVATAILAEILAQQIGFRDVLTVYTAALLHDIGKIVLNRFVGEYFESIFQVVQTGRGRFIDAERQVLGIDHQQLGTEIAKRWRLPNDVVTAIGNHHSPRQVAGKGALVSMIYVSNRMVSAIGIGCGVDGLSQPNQDEVFVDLGITARMTEELLAKMMETLNVTKSFLSH